MRHAGTGDSSSIDVHGITFVFLEILLCCMLWSKGSNRLDSQCL